MLRLAERLNRISEPETLAMARKSRELSDKGFDIINLTLGEPDFNTPEKVRTAAKKAIDDNFSKYSPVNGIHELRQAICRKLKRENNLEYSPEQIVVSTGAKQALINTILCLVNPGDEVILCAPYWVSYHDMVKLAQGIPVIIRAGVDKGYKVPPENIAKAVTGKTKMLILNSPSNPAGTVYTRSEFQSIAAALKDKDIFILSDEIYEYINFTGKHVSIAEFDFVKDQTIIVNGVSKGFAMTGWRLGYMAAPATVAKACTTMQGQFTSGTNSITQKAAVIAMDEGGGMARDMCAEFRERRDRCLEMLSGIPGTKVNIPDGAFYLFPDVSSWFGKSFGEKTIRNSVDLSMYLLNEGLVSTVPGSAFGNPESIRISFATSLANLEKGFKRMKNALEKLK